MGYLAMSFNCCSPFRLWVAMNFVKFDDSKTEFVVAGRITHQSSHDRHLHRESVIPAKSKTRNNGAVIDSSCGLKAHVNMVCRSTYCRLWSIGKIRKYLDLCTAQIATHALVTSNDYLNGRMLGLPANQLGTVSLIFL